MKERFDIHQHITNQIVAPIERGAGELRLPWHRAGGAITRPTNVATKKAYRGVNIVALWAASEQNGFGSGLWGTYRQWAEVGPQVRRGEKSSYIVFNKEIQLDSDSAEQDVHAESETRLFARATPVFAAEQVDGYELPVIASPNPVEPIAAADAFVAASGASIAHGTTRAYYRPSTDSIQLPPREACVSSPTSTTGEAYYSTLLKELTHWTSHERRCNRELGKRFGDSAYAMEELVAELGTAFVCSELGITAEPRADHARYLASCLSVLKADKRAIFTAASKASEATALLFTLIRG